MPVMQSPTMQVRQHLNMVLTRWHRLIKTTCDPYRPELHYMRGPGPKWYAKHLPGTES